MKRIIIAVFSILMFSGAIAAQTVSCYSDFETCPDNFPPDADVIFEARHIRFVDEPTFERDADWYFFDDSSRAWSSLDYVQISPFATVAFDEAFDQLGWEAYLEDADTAIEVRADGNAIYVMDEKELHLIDLSTNLVFSILYREYGTSCTAPDGKRLDWYEDEDAWRELSEKGGTRIVRCRYGFDFQYANARLRTINDPEFIKAGVLKVLNSSSPFYEEKMRFNIEHQLNPPEIWFYHSTPPDYRPFFEIFLKLDGTYEDDLEYGTIGLRIFGFIDLHDRLVRWDIAGQRMLRDYGGIRRKRYVRSAMLNSLERALALTPGKLLLWVETGDDNTLIRNLSTMYTQEEKQ